MLISLLMRYRRYNYCLELLTSAQRGDNLFDWIHGYIIIISTNSIKLIYPMAMSQYESSYQ